VVRSRKHFCHGNATIISLCIVVGLNIAVRTFHCCNRKSNNGLRMQHSRAAD